MKRTTQILLFLLMAAACGALGPQAAVSIYVAPEQLAEQSPLIVEATVERVRSGLDPETGRLATYVTLQVDRWIRGGADEPQLVLRELGGEWDGVVHQLDAVPSYREGERVVTFLEPRADGSLRTNNMFFGKYSIDQRNPRGPRLASRDLEGQGTIVGLPQRLESLAVNDLFAVSSSISLQPEHQGRAWQSHPTEWSRLQWNEGGATDEAELSNLQPLQTTLRELQRDDRTDRAGLDFGALSLSSPARWPQSDSGASVILNVQPDNNPLGNDSLAVTQIGRALDAWNDVSHSRLSLELGDTDFDYTTGRNSPASSYSGINVVLFDDPYDDISDPSGCGGVLAIGGYWRSGSTGAPVNNVTFHPALQLYVIFNNNFQCFLGTTDNLAEVATHEVGHGIGFGHSTVSDAIMRSSAYGNSRGPRLGDDDKEAAHCHYPHTVTMLYPNGGESLTAGSTETIQWSVTAESSGDDGTVDLEYSTDGGANWIPIVTGTANDGSHSWLVPAITTADAMVRAVRPANAPSPYPTSCSGDQSDAALSIVESSPIPGTLSGAGVRLVQLANGDLSVEWSGSCSQDATDYAIYEGSLAALRAGSWDHQPLTCSAGSDLQESITPNSGTRYYLITPTTPTAEGGLGVDSFGGQRPQSASACAVREAGECPA